MLAERYALLTEAMSEGVYDWSVEDGRLEVSGRLGSITGLATSDLTVSDWNERVHAADFDRYRDAVIRHFKGETERLLVEYRIKRASGDYIWIADSGRCLRKDSGEAVRLIGAIRDITGRKLAERRLKEAQAATETARLRLLDAIESISEGIVLFDPEDRIILCNSNYKRYFTDVAGEEIGELVKPGAVFWDFVRIAHARGMLPAIDEKGGIDAYIEMRKEMRRTGQLEPIEQYLSDGRWLQINEHKTANGGTASIYTDITELKKREVELSDQTEALESLSSRLSKYLSPQIYSSIFSNSGNVAVAPKRKKLTVFFSDIVGFTSLVDALESEELTNLLNQYLTEMTKIAIDHGATVDKFIGDAIVAFFGDPVSQGLELDARACVAMAQAMQVRLRELRRDWQDRGLDDTFELRIGISTGFCTVGNFGSDDRLDYTAIGNAVNLASRLQGLAESGGILLDNETFQLVRDSIGPAEELSVSVKGLTKPVRAFKLEGSAPIGDGSVHLNRPGVQVRIASKVIDAADREETVKVLRQALAELETPAAADD